MILVSRENEIKKLDIEIQSIKLPEIKEDEKIDFASKQEKYNIAFQVINSEIMKLKEKMSILKNAKTKVLKYNQELLEKGNDLIEELSSFNLTKEDKSLFFTSFSPNLIEWFNKNIAVLDKAFYEKTGNKENPEKNTYYWYKKELDVIKISLIICHKLRRNILN